MTPGALKAFFRNIGGILFPAHARRGPPDESLRLKQLRKDLSPEDLGRNPELLRYRLNHRLAGTHLSALRKDPTLAPLLSLHSDGHVREAALKALRENPEIRFPLRLLALRLNDWVPTVREVAVQLADKRLPGVAAAEYAALVPEEALAMSRWTRAGKYVVFDRFFGDECTGLLHLLNWLLSARRGPASTILYSILRLPGIDCHIVKLATRSHHPACRKIAVKTILAEKATWPVGRRRVWVNKALGESRLQMATESRPFDQAVDKAEILLAACNDRSAKVRRTVVDYLISTGLHLVSTEVIEKLLADVDPGVADRIDFAKRKRHL